MRRGSSRRRRGSPTSFGIWRTLVISLPPHRFRGGLDGLDDVVIAGAAAEVAGQTVADLRLPGVGIIAEQAVGRHDHARRAVAALQAVLVPEGGLQGVELLALLQGLDRHDLGAVRLDGAGQWTADARLALVAYERRVARRLDVEAALAPDLGVTAPRLDLNTDEGGLLFLQQLEFSPIETLDYGDADACRARELVGAGLVQLLAAGHGGAQDAYVVQRPPDELGRCQQAVLAPDDHPGLRPDVVGEGCGGRGRPDGSGGG